MTGLNNEIPNIQLAIDIITDNCKLSDLEEDGKNSKKEDKKEDGKKHTQEFREQLEYNARTLYGLIHARYVITSRGLQKMLEKYKNGDFGYCPRVHCQLQPLLPIGVDDQPRMSPVKLYCSRCEDLYNPKSSRHSYIDGAFFGTSFPGMFFQTFPNLIPIHSTEMCCPTIYGFELHEYSKLNRWRELQRKKMIDELEQKKVKVYNCPGGFLRKETSRS